MGFENLLNSSKPKQNKIEQVKPIRACLVDFIDEVSRSPKIIRRIEKNGQFINFDGNSKFFVDNKIKNAGEWTYVISEITDKDKYSKRYSDCTGVIVVGEEKNSNRQVSFLSHQSPDSFLAGDSEFFKKDLINSIQELKHKTKDNTIDVVIFGGKRDKNYELSIKRLDSILTEGFGFHPTVITGPDYSDWSVSTQIYFDTQNRHLYILRPPEPSAFNESYNPEDLEDKTRIWYNDNI